MSTLSVWRFSTPHGADAAEYTLRELERHGHIQVEDAAVVSWEPDAKKPHTRRLGSTGKHNTLKGSFWGLVLGPDLLRPDPRRRGGRDGGQAALAA